MAGEYDEFERQFNESPEGDMVTVELTRNELAALHFHYTKHGIPASQVAAKALEKKLEKALKESGS